LKYAKEVKTQVKEQQASEEEEREDEVRMRKVSFERRSGRSSKRG
jgi:hypothetical protein